MKIQLRRVFFWKLCQPSALEYWFSGPWITYTSSMKSVAAPLMILQTSVVLLLASCLTFGPAPAPGETGKARVQGPLPLGRAVNALADDLLLQMDTGTEMALGDVLMGNRKNRLTTMLEDQITIALARRGQGIVQILERKALESVLAETQYSVGGISSNPGTLSQMGRFIPAQVLAVGNVEVFDTYLRFNVRCFSTSNGFLKAASTIEIIRDGDVDSFIPLL